MCPGPGTEVNRSQTLDRPASQTVCTGTVPQFAVITSGQQQFLSPVLLLSSDGLVPSTPLQLVTVAPLDASFADNVDRNVVNSGVDVKQESECAVSETMLANGDASLCGETGKKDKLVNGVCKSSVGNGVPQVVPAVANALAKSRTVDAEMVDGASSVPASPVISKPAYNTRRRRSMSSLPVTSEPARKRRAARHMSTDQLPANKAAANSDNLPSFLSSMTDDE